MVGFNEIWLKLKINKIVKLNTTVNYKKVFTMDITLVSFGVHFYKPIKLEHYRNKIARNCTVISIDI